MKLDKFITKVHARMRYRMWSNGNYTTPRQHNSRNIQIANALAQLLCGRRNS